MPEIGQYRLNRVLSQLDNMASAGFSPRSPRMNHALHSPLEYLPVTRFPTADERMYGHDQLHELVAETKKEREVILGQPYRTTPLITPGAKPRPDLVNNKLTGKPLKPTVYRPLDERSVVATLDENRALVNRQFNSPKSLYSQQNVAEAVYVQTGVNLNAAPARGHFNPEASATYQALLEEESRSQPAKLFPAPHIQQAPPPQAKHTHPHPTAPTNYINSVGAPSSRIAQSESFRRLMLSVMDVQ